MNDALTTVSKENNTAEVDSTRTMMVNALEKTKTGSVIT